jgi:tetraacyldisaccharide 4'-kinase
VLSRGYGRQTTRTLEVKADSTPDEAGDEPLLIKRRCPDVTVLVGSDRLALARIAQQEHKSNVALLDDGFQHRRLSRDLDILVWDGDAAEGNGHLLPRGPLREPLSSIGRASLVWIRQGERPLRAPPNRGVPHVVVRVRPEGWMDPEGTLQPARTLAGRKILAVSGVARPSRFWETLRALEVDLSGTAVFPDHHRFSDADAREVQHQARQDGAIIVTTEKDAVRLPPQFPAWTLRIGLEIVEGNQVLDQQLRSLTGF